MYYNRRIGVVKKIYTVEVLHFVSPNGDVNVNQILQQYVGIENERKELETVVGGKVNVYQIERSLIGKIRMNKNLKDKVTFYTQREGEKLKELVFPKSNAVLSNVRRAA